MTNQIKIQSFKFDLKFATTADELRDLCKRLIKELEHQHDSMSGLWCIDQDPKTVSKEWIDDNAFRVQR